MFRVAVEPLRGLMGLAGVAAILGALVSLWMPLALAAVDRSETPITCGSGWNPDDSVAAHEDSLNHQAHNLVSASYVLSDYAGDCSSMIAERRLLAGGVAVGGVLLTGGLYAWAIAASRRRAEPADPVSSFAAS